MSDLTEKWKNGELLSSDDDHLWLAYYIEHKDGYIHADSFWRGQWGTADRNSIQQILAPVPSYEDWWKLNQLLGKCYRFLRLTETKVEAIEKVKRGLVKEIDEALK